MSQHHIDVVTLDEDLATRTVRAAGVPFSFDADEDEMQRIVASFDFERFVAPLDGDQVVGSGGSFLYDATVPGGVRLPAAGVTFVTVLPTHRRRGVLRRMMRKILDDARARREPLAVLWASEATIYGRFGFGQAVNHVSLRLHRSRTSWRTEPAEGRARLIDADEAATVVPPLHAAACARHGMLGRSLHLWQTYELNDETWQRRGYGARRIVVWERDGRPEGYGFFRTRLGDERRVRVDEFHALTGEAYRGLAAFFAGIDLMETVEFRWRPVDEPLQWMLDDSRALEPVSSEYMWYRLLDVPAALAARTYAGSGELVLELMDAFYPENERRWRLEVDAGGAACTPTDAPADVELDVADLGALYMGGRSAVTLGAAERIRGKDAAVRMLDSLFRTAEPPWSGEDF